MARKDFPQAERDTVQFWKENRIFEKSVEREPAHGDYTFYDGPPFATGTPHYGHIVGSVMKDVVPRYWTMKGYRVERKWGWDCHGLPIENIVEKELNLGSKKDIEALGVDKFNTACRSKIFTYAEEWKKVIARLGRFVDMENDYKTMDVTFMESIWWVFKQLWDKGLIYESYKSMHICPRCETTLSQSEVTEGYATVKDLSVVAKFELVDNPGTFVLAWTTTPWTLPGNVALAVNTELEYALVSLDGAKYIVAKELVEKHFEGKGEYSVESFDVATLLGKKYVPVFDNYADKNLPNKENLYTILSADFVTVEDGTGVVHIAPAFGDDDMKLGQAHDLSFIQHVGEDGRFKADMGDWQGMEVKPKEDVQRTDVEVIKYLAGNGTLFSKEKYEHNYPHCWRCDTPLLNYATNSWFVNVTKLKPRMLELAEKINWQPDHIKEGRFGNWLNGARDWAISRQRYWGSVMPVWRSEDGEETMAIGSIAELEELSGVKVDDLHKHIIDEITFNSPTSGKLMRRIPDVLDCWFESGSMPYAQMHYPFNNKEKMEANYPANFIAEGADQTRAWFYYLHILGTALMDDVAFKNVIVNGIVLAEDGKKMSKRLQNYPDPMHIMDTYGSDAMRLYLMSSPVVAADDLRFAEKGVAEVFRKVVMILWNVYTFYDMYAEEELLSVETSAHENTLDTWVRSRTALFVSDVTVYMDKYDLMRASRAYFDYVNDLSTWYVRRSRDRFKSEDRVDRAAALQTLREVLLTASTVMAPVIPFITEELFGKLRTDDMPESVHLAMWPEAGEVNQAVLDGMATVRAIVEMGQSLRATNQLKVRQALARFEVKGYELTPEVAQILAEELNVNAVFAVIEHSEGEHWLYKEDKGVSVALDSELTPELIAEGHVREMVRFVNLERKKAGLTFTDQTALHVFTESDEVRNAVQKYEEYLRNNTRLTEVSYVEAQAEDMIELKVNGHKVYIKLG